MNNPKQPTSTEEVNVANELTGLDLIVDGNCEKTRESHTAIKLCEFVKEDAGVEELTKRLFPSGILSADSFFDVLDDLRRIVSIGERANEAIGLIWSKAIEYSNEELRTKLITGFVQKGGIYLFTCLESLPVVVREIQFETAFLTNWLKELYQVANAAGYIGDLWKTVRSECENHTEDALEILKSYSESPCEDSIEMMAYMLGVLRKIKLQDSQAAFNELNASLERNPEVNLRQVYYSSWFTTAQVYGLETGELESILESGIEDNDRNPVIEFAAKLLAFGDLHLPMAERCESFLLANTDDSVSAHAKHLVPFAASFVLKKFEDQAVDRSCELARTIAPPDGVGWNSYSNFLCNLLEVNQTAFEELFEELCQTSASIIHDLLANRGLGRLAYQFHKSDIGFLVCRLCVSQERATRRLGIYLFDQYRIVTFDSRAFQTDVTLRLKYLFYETQCVQIDATASAKILSAIARERVGVTEEFDEELREEIVLQCRNYAGACRAELKRIGTDIPLVSESLKGVDDYFKDLKQSHENGINSMQVPGYLGAARLQRKHFSRQVKSNADERSQLKGLFKEVDFLYGRTASQYTNGILTNPVPFTVNEFSVETPIVELCDPEQMAFRRLVANRMLDELDAVHGATGGGNFE